MGIFMLITFILAITCAWSLISPPGEKRRADIVVSVCTFLLAWISVGAVCFVQPPSLYGLLFG